ncbi:sigma-54-dependent Fis family transcriptional regulator [Peribacillus frigoritolerans]|uniref:sigma-54-dependent Fis family transcriptional regulator n=1 Tax=Peribacillus frigoritolerans TaxID=450367 RepID=UPI00201BF1D3|nr:sigma-54-dependent Fis family transcriptional regulator [Peribacillus frigoritolerans]
MFVKDVMTHEYKALSKQSSLREAVQIFQHDKIGLLPVVDANNILLGAFSRYSLYRALLNDCSLETLIEPYIIHDTVSIYENENLKDASLLLTKHNTAHAIVISHDNRVTGIFGHADINRTWQIEYSAVVNSLNSLLKHMHTGALAVDHTGKIVVMNPAAESMCGRSSESTVGLALSELFPELQDILSSIELQAEESLLRHVTIKDRKFLITCNSLSSEDHYWGGLFLLQDFTDYETIAGEFDVNKQLDIALETTIELAFDGFVIVDKQGHIRRVNQAFCELTKMSKDNIIDTSIHDSFPEIKLEETLSDGIQKESVEAVMIGKHHCLITRVPIFQGNEVVGAIGRIVFRNLNKWKNVINRLDNLEKEVSYYRAELSILGGSDFDIDDILSKSEEMRQLKYMARQAAPGFSTVLLLGESGTGKELFARGVHNASRRPGRFVKINCAAVPIELWESEFFGYADGAFTGAKRGGKTGKFEDANNGTLFLDEIGDMPLSMQVKLLRVLQEREFERVGGNQTIHVNVRIIAATNKDLEQMVASGEFREDLYYRLHVIPLHIPPLRKRAEDIPLLATSVSKKFSHMMGIEPITISPIALSLLMAHHWPGNVRELENVIERAMNCMNDSVLESHHLPDYLVNINSRPHSETKKALTTLTNNSGIVENEQNASVYYKKKVSEAEKEAIESALQLANGNRTAAAKILGISRSQFYKKLNAFNIR